MLDDGHDPARPGLHDHHLIAHDHIAAFRQAAENAHHLVRTCLQVRDDGLRNDAADVDGEVHIGQRLHVHAAEGTRDFRTLLARHVDVVEPVVLPEVPPAAPLEVPDIPLDVSVEVPPEVVPELVPGAPPEVPPETLPEAPPVLPPEPPLV